MESRHIKHPFKAVIDSNSKILILGSVPSIKSVEKNFYYGHPQNRFWKILSIILDENMVEMDTNNKTSILLKHHIALYDSVEECDILGSSDNNIENVIPADIEGLISQSKIEHIFCNGNASYKYLIKFHPNLESITTSLPSTSPANAAYSIDKLLNSWNIINLYIK